MNCKQANSVDIVRFLADYGHVPVRIRNSSYWFHSPLHQDSTPSFKVDTAKNTWYDFGIGKGGNLVDFVCILNQADVRNALDIIAKKSHRLSDNCKKYNNQHDSSDTTIIVLEENSAISNKALKQYLNDRCILPAVYQKYCCQIRYSIGKNHFTAIGFKNKMGGYEIRSVRFKGSTSPKFVSWFDNNSKSVHVFEGFFDFLAWQSMLCVQKKNIEVNKSNFLILNSLSFFTRSILLMEKHDHIHLWLDNDKAGDLYTKQIQQRTAKVVDHRTLYAGFKDMNDWWIQQGLVLKLKKGLRL